MTNELDKLSWADLYMSQAFVVAQKSMDPNTKQGCVVTTEDHSPLVTGYNSPPRGCIDHLIPLTSPEKYPFIEHAESNAINNAAREGIRLMGSTFYVTGHPCAGCFKRIRNVGAIRIIYGPVQATKVCFSDEDMKAINIMNQKESGGFHIEFVEYKYTGESISRAVAYLKDKCNIII